MKKNKRFIGLVSILIALIILVPVIGLFVMTSPEKKVEQTTPTSTHVSKVKRTKKPKTTKTSESINSCMDLVQDDIVTTYHAIEAEDGTVKAVCVLSHRNEHGMNAFARIRFADANVENAASF